MSTKNVLSTEKSELYSILSQEFICHLDIVILYRVQIYPVLAPTLATSPISTYSTLYAVITSYSRALFILYLEKLTCPIFTFSLGP